MATRERNDGRMAQKLLDEVRERQEAFAARSAEREAAHKRTQEAFVEAIVKNPVYQRTMEVMNDPVLDQLLPLYWKFWKPIELVSEDVTTETPIKIMGRVLSRIRTIKIVEDVEEERPVPYPDQGPRRILPLDPVGFISKFPVDVARFDGRGLDHPVTAYLQSIGLTTIEDDVIRRLPPAMRSSYGPGTSVHSSDGNWLNRQEYYGDISRIQKVCPSYGGGNCGVIELRTPPAPGRMGDQGKLRIEAGYDLQREDFLVKLYLKPPYVSDIFWSLEALQRKLAEVLVENGVISIEQ